MSHTYRMTHDEFITKAQLAARMKVTTRTIDSWMVKGYVPSRKIGRTVRFSWTEVCERLTAHNIGKLSNSTNSISKPGIRWPGRLSCKRSALLTTLPILLIGDRIREIDAQVLNGSTFDKKYHWSTKGPT
jgi:hypothetical protein